MGRAPRTKDTLPDFHEWRRVTQHPLIFRGLTGSQRTPGNWGVTAYDQINWNFILKVLKRMGFGGKWVGWIKWCMSTATFFVLINGSPTGFFGSSRGLRKGYPLLPYMFVLGMEAISLMIDKATEGGYISGYIFKGINDIVKQITHLLLVDDTLVFCKDSENQMTHLCWILAWFEALSGLKINLEKSSLMLAGRVEDVERIAS